MSDKTLTRFRFKPLFGIKPFIYVTATYGVLLIAIIVLLTQLFSSVFRTKTTVVSWPPKAAVYLDNIKLGYTPLEVTLSRDSELSLIKDGYKDINILVEKPEERLFLSMESLQSNKLEKGYIDGTDWSLISSETIDKRYRQPFIFSDIVSDAHYVGRDTKDIDSFLTSGIKLITNNYLLSDYLRALVIDKSSNRLLSSSSIIDSVKFIDKLVNSYDGLPLLTYNILLDDVDNSVYKSLTNRHQFLLNRHVVSFSDLRRDISFNGMTFLHIPSSEVVPIDVNFYHNIINDEFYILDQLITKELFNTFVKENPEWSGENREKLISKGLVDKNYLNYNNSEEYITHISYYAAEAWCSWANSYFDTPEGYTITLMSENMWYSARHYDLFEDIKAWQWTNNGFYLYDHFLTDDSGKFIPEFTQTNTKVVVGKNQYNDKIESGRGIQRSSWCTPYLSFRPVLIKNN